VILACGFTEEDLKGAGRVRSSIRVFRDRDSSEAALRDSINVELILLNVVFPLGTAYDLLPIVKSFHPNAKVILVTAQAAEAKRQGVKPPGFDEIVSYPIDWRRVEAIAGRV
jgi:DNA-binding NtrC family response regulator